MRGKSVFAAVIAVIVFIAGFVGVSAQNWQLAPSFGEVELTAGFPNDPYKVELVAGGPVDISDLGYYGLVAEAPDFDLWYEAGSFSLTIRMDDTDGDTLLLINDPNGAWHFNDDYDGLDPQITFRNPDSGLYNIWVGTVYDEYVAGVLVITEF
jgi:hypothetical protein